MAESSTKRIVSFDVGIYHMTYSVMTVDSTNHKFHLEEMYMIDLKNGSKVKADFNTLVDALIERLYERFVYEWDPAMKIDEVLVENQPVFKNPTMKSLQMVICTFFKMMGLNTGDVLTVRFVSASNKLKVKLRPPTTAAKTEQKNDQKPKQKNTYKDNKKLAVDIALFYLENVMKNQDQVNFLRSHKKKDDFADSFLQGLHYCEQIDPDLWRDMIAL
jgi:hypothetical protein